MAALLADSWAFGSRLSRAEGLGARFQGVSAAINHGLKRVEAGDKHWPAFQAMLARQLPAYVIREFEDYLRSGRLEHGFLCVRI